jgi:TrmH RNA methyltransferase
LDDNASGQESAEFHEKLAKIAGLKAVKALFRRDPSLVMRLYYNEKMKNAVGDCCAHMAKLRRPYRLVEDSELEKIAGTVLHGGVVAAAIPRTVDEFDIEMAAIWAQEGQAMLIVDGVGNPHNLGAITRTMAFFGLKYLLISDHPAQAGLSDAAHRIAEGGLEYIEVYRVVNLPAVCRKLAPHYRVVGTVLSTKAREINQLPDDARPLALVLGNEEHGVDADTLDACEAVVTIHGAGQVQSLNVSASAAVFLHQLAAMQPGRHQTKETANPAVQRRNPERETKPRAQRSPPRR